MLINTFNYKNIVKRNSLFKRNHYCYYSSIILNSKKKNEDYKNSEGLTLVIVESPAKAKTIEKFINNDKYIIDYCAGHIRDLAKKSTDVLPIYKKKIVSKELKISCADLGIDVYDDFNPLYVDLGGKSDVIKRLKKLSKEASRILLATDEDREGEAISWHLLQVLKPSVPYKRAVFHEITKTAIDESFRNPRDLDMGLVHAQEARRMLDRLTGFTISPLLWRYIAPGLSAGRVQSCGLHAIAERERRRWRFKSSNYYSIIAYFQSTTDNTTIATISPTGSISSDNLLLESRLYSINGNKVATERDFDGTTGELRANNDDNDEDKKKTSKKSQEIIVLDNENAQHIVSWLQNFTTLTNSNDNNIIISNIDNRNVTRKSPIPFITSSLQQESSSKLGFSPSKTMSIAQTLYESGYITYMRTDSPILSSAAKNATIKFITEQYGDDYLYKDNDTKSKVVPKNAQEAHEAIRPAEVDGRFKLPTETDLTDESLLLYSLIFSRTIASLMKPSQSLTRTYTITATSLASKQTKQQSFLPISEAVFRSSETIITFKGYLLANDIFNNIKYKHSSKDTTDTKLYNTNVGERVILASWINHHNNDGDNDSSSDNSIVDGIRCTAHTTRAPSRFTEASFIKELEDLGVGRPSTYSKILQLLKEREYITVEQRTVTPTIKGMVVSNLLEEHFPEITIAKFTAAMEQGLDKIARGECNMQSFLSDFYFGNNTDTDSSSNTAKSEEDYSTGVGLLPMITNKLVNEEIDNNNTRYLRVPFLSDIGRLQYNRFGAYIETNNDITDSSDHSDVDNQTTSSNRWKLPLHMQNDFRTITKDSILNIINKEVPTQGLFLGNDPNTNKKIFLKFGRFGKYLQVGEDNEKVYAGVPKWIDNSISLTDALEFINLPRVIGHHNKLDLPIIADITSGAVCVGVESYPLRVAVDEELLPSQITMELAMELLPDSETILDSQLNLGLYQGEMVSIRKGRYGKYIKWNKLICGLRKTDDISTITVEDAIERLLKKNKKTNTTKALKTTSKIKTKTKVKNQTKLKSKTINKVKSMKVKSKKKVQTIIDTNNNSENIVNDHAVVKNNNESNNIEIINIEAKVKPVKKTKAKTKAKLKATTK